MKNSILQEEASFRFWSQEHVRFADLDPQNHVNNVTFAVYCETARVDFSTKLLSVLNETIPRSWVVASLQISYLRSVFYPANIQIGTRVLSVGNTSVKLGQGLFEGGKCFATGETVSVWFDVQEDKPQQMPDELRTALSEFM